MLCSRDKRMNQLKSDVKLKPIWVRLQWQKGHGTRWCWNQPVGRWFRALC